MDDPFLKRERDQALDGLIQGIDHCDHALRLSDDEGIRMILRGMLKAAQAAGLSETSPKVGEPFSPHTMDAVGSSEGGQEGMVAEVVLRGWLHRGQAWRLASVVVYKGAEPMYLPKGRQGRRKKS